MIILGTWDIGYQHISMWESIRHHTAILSTTDATYYATFDDKRII